MTIAHHYDDSSIITLVDALLARAVACGASDIHLESTETQLRVRFRLDGMLYDQQPIAHKYMAQVLSRLKVLSHIDIAQTRIPQDGKFRIEHNGQLIDLRVSTFPSLHGQKMVVRILDRARTTIDLDTLGFAPDMLAQVKELMNRSHGFFLVVGPTGSGKTTTLYAALSLLNSPEKNIITLEDPVEYNVHGITQGHIHPESGFTFESGIRALLRQDPDIVMVGEIRDKQTAQTAIEAALTGHVVLSTLHTNDAPSAVMRLMDMGIEPFLINAAVNGVIAQRLVRTICQACREPYTPTDAELSFLKKQGVKADTLYRGRGCAACFDVGYKGRTGIFQLLASSNQLRSLIVQNPNFDALNAQAYKDGMRSLMHDGLRKVIDGTITLAELVRVA